MKRLLYFASDYKIGISALLTDQLLSIHRSGTYVVAVGSENEQEPGLISILKKNNVRLNTVSRLDDHADFSRLVNSILEIVKKESIDVVHVQNNWQLAIAFAVKSKLLFRRRLEIVYTLHGFRHNSPIKSRIAQAVIGSALFMATDHGICMTEYLRKKFRLLSYKIALIPLGVKDDFFLQEHQPPATVCLNLIFPAQFRHGKNQDLIITAFSRYIHQSGDRLSTLTLPGNGPLLDEMKSLAKSLGIDKQVKFPGFMTKDEIKQLYLDCNAAIVASNSETFGQSIVEPFVLGRCVISTPVGIAPEIIKDGENGFIFNSEQQLVDIISNLKQNPEVLHSIAKRNFDRRDIFSWDSVTKQYNNSIIRTEP